MLLLPFQVYKVPIHVSFYRYHEEELQFRESPDPPFIEFLFPGTDNVFADNKVWQKVNQLNIELYTDEKSPETEEKIEDILDSYEIPYEKSEYWIESEKMYEVLYQTEIIYGGN